MTLSINADSMLPVPIRLADPDSRDDDSREFRHRPNPPATPPKRLERQEGPEESKIAETAPASPPWPMIRAAPVSDLPIGRNGAPVNVVDLKSGRIMGRIDGDGRFCGPSAISCYV